jgi:hypothetical protein
MDSTENEPIYFALPLGMSLEEYKAMSDIKSFQSAIDMSQHEFIDFDCAVIVSPAFEEVEALRTMLGSDDESIEINITHSKTISKRIELYGIKTIPTMERFIIFKGEKATWKLDMRRDSISAWKVILFNKAKEPIVLPNILVTKDDVEQYFETSSNASGITNA